MKTAPFLPSLPPIAINPLGLGALLRLRSRQGKKGGGRRWASIRRRRPAGIRHPEPLVDDTAKPAQPRTRYTRPRPSHSLVPSPP